MKEIVLIIIGILFLSVISGTLNNINNKQTQILKLIEEMHPYHIKKQNMKRKPMHLITK